MKKQTKKTLPTAKELSAMSGAERVALMHSLPDDQKAIVAARYAEANPQTLNPITGTAGTDLDYTAHMARAVAIVAAIADALPIPDYWFWHDTNVYPRDTQIFEPIKAEFYTYTMRNRPASYGTCPEGRIVDRDVYHLMSEESPNFGTVTYTRKLTPQELYKWEMLPASDNAYLYPVGARVIVNQIDTGTVSQHRDGLYVVAIDGTDDVWVNAREDDLTLDNRPIYTCEEPPAMTSGEMLDDWDRQQHIAAMDAKPRAVNAFDLYQSIVDELRELADIGKIWTYDFCIESLKVIPEKSRQATLEIMEINGLIVRGKTEHFDSRPDYPAEDHTLWKAADPDVAIIDPSRIRDTHSYTDDGDRRDYTVLADPIPSPNVAIATSEPRLSDTVDWPALPLNWALNADRCAITNDNAVVIDGKPGLTPVVKLERCSVCRHVIGTNYQVASTIPRPLICDTCQPRKTQLSLF